MTASRRWSRGRVAPARIPAIDGELMVDKRTVALVQLWPRYAHQFSSQLANHLSDHCHVVVFTSRDVPPGTYEPSVRQVVLPIRVPSKYRAIDVFGLALGLPIVRRLVTAIEQVRADLVHIVFPHPYALAAARILRRRIPILMERHDVEAHPGEGSLLRSSYDRLELSIPTGFLVHSEAVRRRLEQTLRGKRRPIWTIPLGDVSPRTTQLLPEPDAGHQVLFFGRIYHYKGLDVLLEAAPRIIEQIPNVRFVLAGDGHWQPYSERISGIPERNISVHRGVIDDETMAELFNHANLVVLPYREASQSGIIPLAAAFGRAVLASSVGGIPESIQDGVNGALVEPENPAELARKTVDLLRNAALRKSYAEALRQDYAGRYSFESLQWAYQTCYEELLAGPVVDGVDP